MHAGQGGHCNSKYEASGPSPRESLCWCICVRVGDAKHTEVSSRGVYYLVGGHGGYFGEEKGREQGRGGGGGGVRVS
jgi:hypothetical protein